jgi:aspartyl-tRNA synthetase
VFDGAECVSGLCVPPEHGASFSRGKLDKLGALAKQRESGGAKGLAWTRIGEDGSFTGGIAKNVPAPVQAAVGQAMGAVPGSVLLFVADTWHTTHTVLSNLRLHLRDELSLVPADAGWKFLWVTDFPLFEKNDKGQFVSSHHPFTSPRPEHVDLMVSDPAAVRAQAYDLALNGLELLGGSIRIHSPELQEKVLNVIGMGHDEAHARFGFLLEGLRFGAPPHGGFAMGTDRLVALLLGLTQIRDVIAFPKTTSATDLMTGAPTVVDAVQLAELGLQCVEPKR